MFQTTEPGGREFRYRDQGLLGLNKEEEKHDISIFLVIGRHLDDRLSRNGKMSAVASCVEFFRLLFVLYFGTPDHSKIQLPGILSLCQTPQLLCGIVKCSWGASVDTGVRTNFR